MLLGEFGCFLDGVVGCVWLLLRLYGWFRCFAFLQWCLIPLLCVVICALVWLAVLSVAFGVVCVVYCRCCLRCGFGLVG